MIDKELFESLRSMVESTPRSNLRQVRGPFSNWARANIAKDVVQDYGNQPNDLGAYMEKTYSYFKELFQEYKPLIQNVREILIYDHEYDDQPSDQLREKIDELIGEFTPLNNKMIFLIKSINRQRDLSILSEIKYILKSITKMKNDSKTLILAIKTYVQRQNRNRRLDYPLTRLKKLPLAIFKYLNRTDLINFLQNSL